MADKKYGFNTFTEKSTLVDTDRALLYDSENAGTTKWYSLANLRTLIQTGFSYAHNFLTGLQGGTTNEYYHTTSAQNAALHSHADLVAVEKIVDNGDGTRYLTNDGTYKPIYGFGRQGSISLNTDFPLIADVQSGWWYSVTATVTDNAGATYTNTGKTFYNGDEIYWDGATWQNYGSLFNLGDEWDAYIGVGQTYTEPADAVAAGKYRLFAIGNVTWTKNTSVPNTVSKIIIGSKSQSYIFAMGIYKFTGGGANKPIVQLENLNITNNAGTNLLADFTGYFNVFNCNFSENVNLSTTGSWNNIIFATGKKLTVNSITDLFVSNYNSDTAITDNGTRTRIINTNVGINKITGLCYIRPVTDAADTFTVGKANGTSIFNIDSVNSAMLVNTSGLVTTTRLKVVNNDTGKSCLELAQTGFTKVFEITKSDLRGGIFSHIYTDALTYQYNANEIIHNYDINTGIDYYSLSVYKAKIRCNPSGDTNPKNSIGFYADIVNNTYKTLNVFAFFAENGRSYFADTIDFKKGKYFYFSATYTSDTIGDVRISNQSGVYKIEYCTVANALKGSGTWVEYMKILADGKPYLYLNGALKEVEVGAADSGGTGYRLLRITN